MVLKRQQLEPFKGNKNKGPKKENKFPTLFQGPAGPRKAGTRVEKKKGGFPTRLRTWEKIIYLKKATRDQRSLGGGTGKKRKKKKKRRVGVSSNTPFGPGFETQTKRQGLHDGKKAAVRRGAPNGGTTTGERGTDAQSVPPVRKHRRQLPANKPGVQSWWLCFPRT